MKKIEFLSLIVIFVGILLTAVSAYSLMTEKPEPITITVGQGDLECQGLRGKARCMVHEASIAQDDWDCKKFTNFYLNQAEEYEIAATDILYFVEGEGHTFAIIYNSEGHCVLDQSDYRCFERPV